MIPVHFSFIIMSEKNTGSAYISRSCVFLVHTSLVHIGTFNYVCFEWQSHFLSPPVLPKTNFPLLFPYSMFVGIFSLFTMLGLRKAIQGSHCRNIRSLLKNILNLRECFSEKDIFQTLTIEKAYLLSLEMISISLPQWQK